MKAYWRGKKRSIHTFIKHTLVSACFQLKCFSCFAWPARLSNWTSPRHRLAPSWEVSAVARRHSWDSAAGPTHAVLRSSSPTSHSRSCDGSHWLQPSLPDQLSPIFNFGRRPCFTSISISFTFISFLPNPPLSKMYVGNRQQKPYLSFVTSIL